MPYLTRFSSPFPSTVFMSHMAENAIVCIACQFTRGHHFTLRSDFNIYNKIGRVCKINQSHSTTVPWHLGFMSMFSYVFFNYKTIQNWDDIREAFW